MLMHHPVAEQLVQDAAANLGVEVEHSFWSIETERFIKAEERKKNA